MGKGERVAPEEPLEEDNGRRNEGEEEQRQSGTPTSQTGVKETIAKSLVVVKCDDEATGAEASAPNKNVPGTGNHEQDQRRRGHDPSHIARLFHPVSPNSRQKSHTTHLVKDIEILVRTVAARANRAIIGHAVHVPVVVKQLGHGEDEIDTGVKRKKQRNEATAAAPGHLIYG